MGFTAPNLWTSDGTEAGTRLLADIHPGPESSMRPTTTMVVLGDHAYFTATADGVTFRMWRTDGETVELVDDSINRAGFYTVLGDELYFTGRGPDDNLFDLFRLGPNDATPHRFAGLHAGDDEFAPSRLTVVGDALYFTADDGVHGREPWRIPTPGAEPELVADITPGPADSDVRDFTTAGDSLLIVLETDDFGQELWVGRTATPGDYDRDGLVTRSDQAIWRATYGSTDDLRADGNRNGLVEAADYSVWRDAYSQATGDYDFDGVVDPADEVVWRQTYGSRTDLRADGNNNGIVDAGDYLVWRDAYDPVVGDYDLNGRVSAADGDLWRDTYGSGVDLRADANRNGRVDAGDYTLWRDALTAATQASAAQGSAVLSSDAATRDEASLDYAFATLTSPPSANLIEGTQLRGGDSPASKAPVADAALLLLDPNASMPASLAETEFDRSPRYDERDEASESPAPAANLADTLAPRPLDRRSLG